MIIEYAVPSLALNFLCKKYHESFMEVFILVS